MTSTRHRRDQLRRAIDDVDHEIINCLGRRLTLAFRILEEKRAAGEPLEDNSREEEIFDSITEHAAPDHVVSIQEIFKAILEQGKKHVRTRD